ncbi:cbb3-type cytochrome oxidase assembly protein CcoS (plasmid) [Rhizobium sp. 32-5/1]|uniref:cbb3-type cytochrome oxidase assembly protein CcoS n=1 Tax=Rhizobium sp. 32-5/1 TaxID=3019602 RepID=UPI00240D8E49|nr:cbb3-type cytochrome oxidase assembly protein CcoS [Rhizobium sp. 32-5/1]WEZ86101.1 cbb3-type cytochrome oxidase assembly protein CcoS [Rhizobium sp. 32-5/1]
MGAAGLLAFLWSMRSKQYEDLDGAAERDPRGRRGRYWLILSGNQPDMTAL